MGDAATIRDWVAERDLAAATAGLADPTQSAVLLAAADRLADAADSDDAACAASGLRELFTGLVEPLNDGFRPAGRAVYARCFGRIVWRICRRHPDLAAALDRHGIASEAALLARHARLRDPDRRIVLPPAPRRIVVLSRVTIGADVLLSTILLQALRARFPDAVLVLVGDAKLRGLLGGLPGLRIAPLAYARRGALRERLRAWLALDELITTEAPDLMVAADSRLDQLGLLPLLPADRYLLWEGLMPEDRAPCSLGMALAAWSRRVLDLAASTGLRPQLFLDPATAARRERLRAALGQGPLVAIKLDHGGNPAKALPAASERALLAGIRAQGWRVLLDRGFGAAELAGSDALLADLAWQAVDLDDGDGSYGRRVDALQAEGLAAEPVLRFHGSIAGWTAALACCDAALSYDSVGHHLAAALGVPLVTAFTGHASAAFVQAWHPQGPGRIELVEIPPAQRDEPQQVQRLLARLALLLPAPT